MRTTRELIDALTDEAQRLTLVGLVVGFDHHSAFIFYQPDAEKALLDELNRHVQSGGVPLGFVGAMHLSEREWWLYHRALPEHANEPGLRSYFEQLLGRMRALLIARGIRAGLIRPEWN